MKQYLMWYNCVDSKKHMILIRQYRNECKFFAITDFSTFLENLM